MGENSQREQIVIANLNIVKAIKSIQNVDRTQKNYSDLQNYAITQFPVAAVISGLPRPLEKKSSRSPAIVDVIKSELKITVIVYIQERDNPDSMLSYVADDLWKKLYLDPTRGGLVLSTLLGVDEQPQYWDPYLAFKIDIFHTYLHDTGGI